MATSYPDRTFQSRTDTQSTLTPFPAVDNDAHIHGVPPVGRNDIEQRAEVTITWDLAVQRGEQLICQMMNTKEWATKELIEKGKLHEGGSSQSRWTDPNEMADYGWVVSTGTPDADDTIQTGLQWVGAKSTYPRDSLVMATMRVSGQILMDRR